MIARYEYGLDTKGEWRWTAIASNGELIAVSSEGYKDVRDCLRAIALMKDSGNASVMIRGESRTPALAAYAMGGSALRSALAQLSRHRQVRAEDTILGAALSKARAR